MTNRIIKVLVIALVINTTVLTVADFDGIRSQLTAVVNFSMTIAPAPELPSSLAPSAQNPLLLVKPLNALPQNGSFISLPFTFSIDHNTGSGLQVAWIFRTEFGSYKRPLLFLQSSGASGNVLMHVGQFGQNKKYLWKTQYIADDGSVSDFSDETSFMVKTATFIKSQNPALAAPPPSAPAPESSKTSQPPPPPLKVNLKNTKIPKGGNLDIIIQRKTKPTLQSQRKLPVDLSVKIFNSSGVPAINKTEKVKNDTTFIQKSIQETQGLSIGSYVAILSYNEDGTQYAYAEDFEVQDPALINTGSASSSPSPHKNFLTALLLWNELFIGVMLLGAVSLIYVGRHRRS